MTKERALKQIISQQRETIKALKEQGEKCNIYIESLEGKFEAANKILSEPLEAIGEDGGLYRFLDVESMRSRLRECLSQELTSQKEVT